MSTRSDNSNREPTRSDIDALSGPTLLEFGTSWCGFCRAAQPHIATALREYAGVRHIKVEDGSGLPLGRSFTVKLWPTLVFLRDGVERSRLVRPRDSHAIAEHLDAISEPGRPGPANLT